MIFGICAPLIHGCTTTEYSQITIDEKFMYYVFIGSACEMKATQLMSVRQLGADIVVLLWKVP